MQQKIISRVLGLQRLQAASARGSTCGVYARGGEPQGACTKNVWRQREYRRLHNKIVVCAKKPGKF